MGTWWDSQIAPSIPPDFGTEPKSVPDARHITWVSGGMLIAAALGAAIAGKRMEEMLPKPSSNQFNPRITKGYR